MSKMSRKLVGNNRAVCSGVCVSLWRAECGRSHTNLEEGPEPTRATAIFVLAVRKQIRRVQKGKLFETDNGLLDEG
jgi:hypothetical protein